MADATSAPLFDSGLRFPTPIPFVRDEIMNAVEQRLLALDRVWDLVTNSEAADQNTIAVADIRAAITTRRAS